jgi:hypothetical protein
MMRHLVPVDFQLALPSLFAAGEDRRFRQVNAARRGRFGGEPEPRPGIVDSRLDVLAVDAA